MAALEKEENCDLNATRHGERLEPWGNCGNTVFARYDNPKGGSGNAADAGFETTAKRLLRGLRDHRALVRYENP